MNLVAARCYAGYEQGINPRDVYLTVDLAPGDSYGTQGLLHFSASARLQFGQRFLNCQHAPAAPAADAAPPLPWRVPLDSDLGTLAHWQAPASLGSAGQRRQVNVVTLTEPVMARRQRVSHA